MENPFEKLCNDEVFLESRDGQRKGPFKCALDSKSVRLFEKDLDVEEGAKVLRQLPGGRVESYTVLEVNYSPGLMNIPPNWHLKVQKDSSLVEREGGRTVNVSIHDSQGIQIGDHNLQNVTIAFQALLAAIEQADAPSEQKQEAKGRLKRFLEHPLVTSVLGGAAGGIAGILK
jgi:hypothetical protein